MGTHHSIDIRIRQWRTVCFESIYKQIGSERLYFIGNKNSLYKSWAFKMRPSNSAMKFRNLQLILTDCWSFWMKNHIGLLLLQKINEFAHSSGGHQQVRVILREGGSLFIISLNMQINFDKCEEFRDSSSTLRLTISFFLSPAECKQLFTSVNISDSSNDPS